MISKLGEIYQNYLRANRRRGATGSRRGGPTPHLVHIIVAPEKKTPRDRAGDDREKPTWADRINRAFDQDLKHLTFSSNYPLLMIPESSEPAAGDSLNDHLLFVKLENPGPGGRPAAGDWKLRTGPDPSAAPEEGRRTRSPPRSAIHVDQALSLILKHARAAPATDRSPSTCCPISRSPGCSSILAGRPA